MGELEFAPNRQFFPQQRFPCKKCSFVEQLAHERKDLNVGGPRLPQQLFVVNRHLFRLRWAPGNNTGQIFGSLGGNTLPHLDEGDESERASSSGAGARDGTVSPLVPFLAPVIILLGRSCDFLLMLLADRFESRC